MKVLIVVSLVLAPILLTAQKRIVSLPFEFEKNILASSDYDAYFLDNKPDQVVSLILKDNRKASYVQLDKNFKIISQIDLNLNSTVFNEDIADYLGGTTNGNVFNFIYQEKDKKSTGFQIETVNYNTKTVTHRSLFEIPKTETVVSSFSDNNIYYTITADDKANELVFYRVTETGTLTQKRIPFTIPAGAVVMTEKSAFFNIGEIGKRQIKLSTYLKNLHFFNTDEAPDLSSAVTSAKLFGAPESLSFIINNEGQPVHLFSIQLPDFSVKESFIDLNNFKKDPTEKLYINSFKKGDLLFSLILNKKSIQFAVHQSATGELVGKQEINEASNFNIFAHPPVSEKRLGKSDHAKKDIDNIKKTIKALNQGTEGIMVTQNEKGQYIVTIGTYNLIRMTLRGSSGGWTGGYTSSSMAINPSITSHGSSVTMVPKYNPYMYYRPGTPIYTISDARFYTSTYFRLLLDGTGTNYAKGIAPMPVSDQIKDYLEEADPRAKAKATNQFSIGERQFYGYYDKDAKAYVIEEIQVKR